MSCNLILTAPYRYDRPLLRGLYSALENLLLDVWPGVLFLDGDTPHTHVMARDALRNRPHVAGTHVRFFRHAEALSVYEQGTTQNAHHHFLLLRGGDCLTVVTHAPVHEIHREIVTLYQDMRARGRP